MEHAKAIRPILNLPTRVVFFLMLCAVQSCSPTTGARSPSGPPSLTGFKTLALTVTAQEGFSVRLVREQSPNAGSVLAGIIGVLGGLPGVAVGFAVGSAMDSVSRRVDGRSAERLEPYLNRLDPEKLFRERMLNEFANDQPLAAVMVIAASDNAAMQNSVVDGLLTVTIKQWGVRRCASAGREDKVQAGLLYNSRIAAPGNAPALWERDELYLDGECYSLSELDAKASLLPTILARALENASGKLANEIRFP